MPHAWADCVHDFMGRNTLNGSKHGMNENQVIIYSNGIADFQRGYVVKTNAPKHISIPVRQDHLADVLASFNVYGNVTLESPPTFRPSNELEGNISLEPQRVLEDITTKLSGARISLERASGSLEGTLLGLHQEQEADGGEPFQVKSLVVLTSAGVRRCLLREIQSFQFLDEDVQTEINKALQRNYQRIKPNSTFVELELSTQEDESDAVVQYSIPAAAWKISYRLRLAEDKSTELQGFAIVDNNTDEDWVDFHVSVVTGEPITFSTDLADSKSPQRKHVNLVSETALGAVEVEVERGGTTDFDEGILAAAFESPTVGASATGKFRGGAARSKQPLAKRAGVQPAKVAQTEVEEVGDFSIFHSDSAVSIPAKRSTVIPVFQVAVDDVKSVLHYKHANHAERPYRSVDFTNQTDFSLGRGVCTVFEDAAYAGNCILPPLKPGESRLLPHALETGVSVFRGIKRQRNKVVALRLSEGSCYTSTRQQRETHYRIKNLRDQAYKLVLDHNLMLSEPEVEARCSTQESEELLEIESRLSDGVRYVLQLSSQGGIAAQGQGKATDRVQGGTDKSHQAGGHHSHPLAGEQSR